MSARQITEAEATIVYQAATMAGLQKQANEQAQALQQLAANNAALRQLVPDKALSSDAEMATWKQAVAEMNKEFAQAGGKAADKVPDAANDMLNPPPVDPNKKGVVTPLKNKKKG